METMLIVAERREITSLKAPPPGWEVPESRERRLAWLSTPRGPKSPNHWEGPREDAEPTAELRTLTPGIDILPARCSNCGSQFVTREPPLDGEPRGRVTCHTCGRQLAWLALPLAVTRSATSTPQVAVPERTPVRSMRPVITSQFHRLDGCGPACSIAFGHDPATHEAIGRQSAAEIEPPPTGRVRTGPLVVDFDQQRILVDGVDPGLSPTELKIVAYLAQHIGRVRSHAQIICAVWGAAMADQQDGSGGKAWHLSRVNITRARAKLGSAAELIETRPSVGYLLRADPAAEESDERARRPGPHLRTERLHRVFSLRPGRTRLVVVAGSRQGRGAERPFFRRRNRSNAVSTNGTAQIVERPTDLVVMTAPAEQPAPPPGEPPAAEAELGAVLQLPIISTVHPVTLPDSMVGWYAETRHLAAQLLVEETLLAEQLERVSRTRTFLDGVLGQVIATEPTADGEPVPAALASAEPDGPMRRHPGPAALSGRWTRAHAACIDCGRSDRKHKGGGRCSACYASAERAAIVNQRKELTS